MMRRLKVVLSYDGTEYHGFQRQGRGLVTVQDVLFAAIEAVTGGLPKRFAAAGRTDAGVHALGQVIAFDTAGTIPSERVAAALNANLPGDVSAVSTEEVSPAFHPRFDAAGKEYAYTLLGFNGKTRQALLARYALWTPGALDLTAMAAGARAIEGAHDFSAFQDVGRPVKDATRTVGLCRVVAFTYAEPPFAGIPAAQIVVRADGFLYHMVRVIAGTLVEVGRGRFDPARIAEIVAGRDRRAAGPTLPAHGLCLVRVDYAGTPV